MYACPFIKHTHSHTHPVPVSQYSNGHRLVAKMSNVICTYIKHIYLYKYMFYLLQKYITLFQTPSNKHFGYESVAIIVLRHRDRKGVQCWH